MKRVAVTGIGLISPLGNSTAEVLQNVIQGKSGIHKLDNTFHSKLASPLAATVQFDATPYFEPAKLRMLDRSSQFAVIASRHALNDAGLNSNDLSSRSAGVFLGTCMAGANATDEAYLTLYAKQYGHISPYSILLSMNSAAASWICLEQGITGPSFTYNTACSSSSVAIGEAARRIQNGERKIMIAGGTDASIALGPLKAWEALRTLANADPNNIAASCKPFSKNRTGMVLGEGATIFILEEWEGALKRDARIYAELNGYGTSTDSTHITKPTVSGQAQAMHDALMQTRLEPSSIDYVNAHGTGTIANDSTETAAIKKVFGEYAYRLPISSTKSMHGHLLGASGALELAITILSMQAKIIPPTLNYEIADPECDLDYVANQTRENVCLQIAMSNSFAFGGTNAVLIASMPK